jgi:hypothetical protein
MGSPAVVAEVVESECCHGGVFAFCALHSAGMVSGRVIVGSETGAVRALVHPTQMQEASDAA